VFRSLLWHSVRGLLWTRYRVRVNGLETLTGLGPKSKVLILPNHPGYVDPMLVLSRLGPQLGPRPLVFEGTFANPLLWPFMKLVNALPVPDMEAASTAARATAQASVQAVIDGLRAGNNHILWPSGRLQRRGVEVLGGARALTDILEAVPDCEIVLVRTRGLWGSMFSFAYTGKLPALTPRMLGGLGTLLSNLLFFTPRRDITLTVERLDKARIPKGRREEVNAFFEAWYNAEGPEEPKFVPYHFAFGRRTYEYPRLATLANVDVSGVKDEVKDEVVHLLAEKIKRPLEEAEKTPQTHLDALGLDSLDRMELSLHLEQRFGFATDQVPATVGECLALAAGLVEKAPPRPAPEAWFRRPTGRDAEPAAVLGETLGEAFVNRALANPHDVADADDMAGCLTYERMLVGALLFSTRFAKIPAANVGLMLPASVGGDIAFLALQLAGKLPVLLNWTTGPANLAHAARLMGLTHVVTSRKFLDRTGLAIEGVEMLFVEDLKPGKFEMLRTLLRVRWRPGAVRRSVPRLSPDSPAVVLFTSGSEKAPKAVPLTHRNLITNIREGFKALGMTRGDSFLGFLPAFHSFGLTVTFLGPILCGLRVVRHPDPTDAVGLMRKIASYKVTALASTPTFLSFLFDRIKEDELASLHLVFLGAEKCPATVFERAKTLAPQAHLREGYGITECSPVVSVNMREDHRPGTVGKPLPCVETLVVDLAKAEGGVYEAVKAGDMGLLLVAGPTVFPGYIGHDGDSPFQEVAGRRWYVTGDLVQMDADGFIHFRGRLKRFVKVGGEMVSLPELEEPLARVYPPVEKAHRVAVETVEGADGQKIVLFTTLDITLREANAILWEAGLRGVKRLDTVCKVGEIPTLGTGKLDYKILRTMIQD
jgi:long-chain-fatty-acid--[acyl-carrier-protein] ligase